MNWQIGIAIVASTLFGTAAAAEPAPQPAPTLLRSALLVANADRSIAFYRQLGFAIEADSTTPRKPIGNPFPVNSPATQTRLVILANKAGGGHIGLVEFSKPAPRSTRRDHRRVGLGDVVLVFDVADAEAIFAMLTASGSDIIEPPQTFTSSRKAPDGSPLHGKVFHARDPDGYLVELLQAAR